MKCKVYPSKKCSNRYVILPSNCVTLPPQVKEEIEGVIPWKEIVVESKRRLLGLDSEEAEKNLNAVGYHIEEVGCLFEERVVKARK